MSIAVSVVIPTHNGATRLLRCLDSLSRQTLAAQNYETIVVVDGSTDDTIGELAVFSTPFHLVLVEQQRRGARLRFSR
jgi:glycosyltransferase involved in cell wall biosynthesis